MKYAKNMLWSKPYVSSVLDLFPAHRVRKIVSYRVPLDKDEATDGITLRDRSGRFDVRIRLVNKVKDYGPKRNRYKYKANYLGSLLNTLAHELAHTVHWEHTTDHLELELKMMRRFLRVAKKLEVKDTWARVKLK